MRSLPAVGHEAGVEPKVEGDVLVSTWDVSLKMKMRSMSNENTKTSTSKPMTDTYLMCCTLSEPMAYDLAQPASIAKTVETNTVRFTNLHMYSSMFKYAHKFFEKNTADSVDRDRDSHQ